MAVSTEKPARPRQCRYEASRWPIPDCLRADYFQMTLMPYLSTLENYPVIEVEEHGYVTDLELEKGLSREVGQVKPFEFVTASRQLSPEVLRRCAFAMEKLSKSFGDVDTQTMQDALGRMIVGLSRRGEYDLNHKGLLTIARFRLLDTLRHERRQRKRFEVSASTLVELAKYRDALNTHLATIDLLDRFLPFIPLPNDTYRRVVLMRSAGWRASEVACLLRIRPYEVTRWFASGRRVLVAALASVCNLPFETRRILHLRVTDGLATHEIAREVDLRESDIEAHFSVIAAHFANVCP